MSWDGSIAHLRRFRDVCTREGSDAAVQAAQDMIAAGAAWIAQEHGPEEARRVLQVVQAAHGEESWSNVIGREAPGG
jgi:hypothetical protein